MLRSSIGCSNIWSKADWVGPRDSLNTSLMPSVNTRANIFWGTWQNRTNLLKQTTPEQTQLCFPKLAVGTQHYPKSWGESVCLAGAETWADACRWVLDETNRERTFCFQKFPFLFIGFPNPKVCSGLEAILEWQPLTGVLDMEPDDGRMRAETSPSLSTLVIAGLKEAMECRRVWKNHKAPRLKTHP